MAQPYIIFCNEQRPKIYEENPGISIPNVAKIMGERWKALSDVEKTKYIDQSIDSGYVPRYSSESVARRMR